jgi:hypothetical protein
VNSAHSDCLSATPGGRVHGLQQAVITALRQGAELASVHKEGGTVIRCEGGHFVAEDFGQNPQLRQLACEAELLRFVWRHFEHSNQRDAAPQALTEALGWRMIHARLSHPGPAAHGAAAEAGLRAGRPRSPWSSPWTLGAAAATLALAALLAANKFQAKADAARGEAKPVALQQVVPPPVVRAAASGSRR